MGKTQKNYIYSDIIIRQIQVMKNFSFSTTSADDSYKCKKSTELTNYYRHSELRASEANQRIEEIKKKYDTPSRRERIESLKKSQHFAHHRTPLKEDAKQNAPGERTSGGIEKNANYQHVPTFGTNPLKESFAVNRLEKSALKKQDCKQLDSFHRSSLDRRSPLEEKGMNLLQMKSQAMEEEEALFSKVREMKESLINQDVMKSSVNGRSSISSFKHNNGAETRVDHSAHNPNNGRNFDPRVENIDKINSKIKQILSCLNQNQKHPSKYIKDQDPKRSYLHQDPRSSTLNSHIFHQKDDKVRNSFLNAEPERSKIFAPFSSIPSEANKIEESNVYNFYKNTGESEAFKSSYQESTPNTNDEKYSHKHKPSADVKSIHDKYKQRRQRQSRDYSIGKSQSYSSNLFKRKEEIARTPTCLQTKPFDQKSNINASRTRSQIDNISRSGLSQNDKDLLKSGKKLGDEISRIQNKIQQLQNKKKNLNIQFTPFSMKNRSASVIATAKHMTSIESNQKASKMIEKPLVPHFRSSSSATKERQPTAHFGNHSHLNEQRSRIADLNRSTHHEPTDREMASPTFQLSLEQVDVDVRTVRIQKPEESNNEEASINRQPYQLPTPTMNKETAFAYDEIKKRTDEGMEERKKKLQFKQQIIKTDTLKKLVHLFCQQAKFDENLRNLKIWLQASNDKNKFASLSTALKRHGVDQSQRECQGTFKVDESEHNPFFSVQGFDGSIEAVAKAYLEADRHWSGSIRHKFDKDNLQMQGFTKNKIDLQRKGFIQLQDLVRLLNIESGTFYRNRDIYLIFHRLTSQERTSFEQILGQIAAQ